MKRKRLSPPAIIASAAALALALRVFALDLTIVRGNSMTPSASDGDLIVFWKAAYGLGKPFGGGYLIRWRDPAPGDAVVAVDLSRPRVRALKRVFETGPAFMLFEDGVWKARGGELPPAPGSLSSSRLSIYVPPGAAFLVGDNPAASYDSRHYGPVPIENIAGKVLLYFPNPASALFGRRGPGER